MTFGESVSICFRKYFVFQGRASLSEFWWFQLIWVLAYLSIMIFSDNDPIVFFFLGIIISIALPLVAVSIRRLHDTNKSGLYILWNFIPFIGGIIFIALMIGTGTKGKNKYGPDPLKRLKKKK
jgi:uncharacterized membrane protein YhaH (DUF805 family)